MHDQMQSGVPLDRPTTQPTYDEVPSFDLGWNIRALIDVLGIPDRDAGFEVRLWPNSMRPILADKARHTTLLTLQRLASGLGVDICDVFAINGKTTTVPLRVAITRLRLLNNECNDAYNTAIDDVLNLIAERWPNKVTMAWPQPLITGQNQTDEE